MKRWIFQFRVQPPHMQTVMARSGGSVFDAAYSRTFDEWYQVVPGGTLEKIPEPQMIFVSEAYARENARDFSKHPPRSGQKLSSRQKKPIQLSLALT